MARPRKIVDPPPPPPKPVPPPGDFVAVNFGPAGAADCPRLDFLDAAGKKLSIYLAPDALRLWRRFTRGNV